MRNDLIIFEFENADGREVLLEPVVVAEMANALESVFLNGSIHLEVSSDWPPEASEIRFFLAAVEPASVRLGFRALFGKLTPQDRANLETADTTLSILERLVDLFFKAGIGAYLFHPIIPSPAKDQTVEIEAAHGTIAADMAEPIEGLINVSLQAGADRVIISAPDQPRCVLSKAKFRHDFLGIKAPALPEELIGHVTGTLKILGGPIPFETKEGVKALGLAAVTLNYRRPQDKGAETEHHTHVLVEWQSNQPYPSQSDHRISVVGELRSLDRSNVTALEELVADHRQVNGILKVTGMQIFD